MRKLDFISSQNKLPRKIPILKREKGSKYTFDTKRLTLGQTGWEHQLKSHTSLEEIAVCEKKVCS